MKKIIAAVLLAVFTLVGTPSGFLTGLAYARPIQLDARRLTAVTQKMNSMAQTVSEEYAAKSLSNRSVPSPEHILKPAADLTKEVIGYYTEDWVGDTASLNSVNTNGSKMTGIATFSFQVRADGQINGSAPLPALRSEVNAGGKTLALIHNYNNNNFDRNIIHTVISNSTVRNQAIANILSIVRTNSYDGVNIDFENISGNDRSSYTSFITQLSRALHRYGYVLTVSIPAKTLDDKTGWGGAFDYRAIGAAADRVMLMTYDEHWFGSTPGAVASAPWVDKVIQYALTVIPSTKILLGIGTYGYDWVASSSSGTTAVSSAGAFQIIGRYQADILWDDNAQTPYFYYKKNGSNHVVWFESNESAAFKMNMVNKYNLAGIAIWRLGFEANGFWQTVTDTFGK